MCKNWKVSTGRSRLLLEDSTRATTRKIHKRTTIIYLSFFIFILFLCWLLYWARPTIASSSRHLAGIPTCWCSPTDRSAKFDMRRIKRSGPTIVDWRRGWSDAFPSRSVVFDSTRNRVLSLQWLFMTRWRVDCAKLKRKPKVWERKSDCYYYYTTSFFSSFPATTSKLPCISWNVKTVHPPPLSISWLLSRDRKRADAGSMRVGDTPDNQIRCTR